MTVKLLTYRAKIFMMRSQSLDFVDFKSMVQIFIFFFLAFPNLRPPSTLSLPPPSTSSSSSPLPWRIRSATPPSLAASTACRCLSLGFKSWFQNLIQGGPGDGLKELPQAVARGVWAMKFFSDQD